MCGKATIHNPSALIGKSALVVLTGVFLLTVPITAHATVTSRGSAATGVSSTGSSRLSSQRRAELEAQIRFDQARLALEYQHLDDIEDVIAVAKLVDVTFSVIAGIALPGYGGAAYSASKAITFAAFGQYDEALSSTVSAATSIAGSVAYSEAKATTDVTVAVMGSAVKAASDVYSWSNKANTATESLNELAD